MGLVRPVILKVGLAAWRLQDLHPERPVIPKVCPEGVAVGVSGGVAAIRVAVVRHAKCAVAISQGPYPKLLPGPEVVQSTPWLNKVDSATSLHGAR